MARKPPPRRQRRSAAEAREAILTAAVRRLAEHGPDALRLQEIARDVGITHPAVLHHFGSRERLVEEVARRVVEELELELLALLEEPDAGPDRLLERVFARLVERRHSRLLAWLLLTSSEGATDALARSSRLGDIARAVHRRRMAELPGRALPVEDSLYSVLLVVLVVLGEAVAGDTMVRKLGFGDPAALRAGFRRWLGAVLVQRLTGS